MLCKSYLSIIIVIIIIRCKKKHGGHYSDFFARDINCFVLIG